MGRILVELHVHDLGVIDDVTVALGPGMTALTGETGAGKTLLVGALGLLLGGRGDPAVVRAGAEEAYVEGRFAELDGTDEVVLARSVAREGRSRAWVDGRAVPVGELAGTAAGLLELHGQHQHRTLVVPEAQRRALDAFGGIDGGPLEDARRRLAGLLREAEGLGGDGAQRAREAELLAYQVDEVDRAALSGPDEDEVLEAEEDRLAEASAHRAAAAAALSALVGPDDGREGPGALDRLAEASGALAGRAPLEALDRRVRDSMAELGDLAGELRAVVETWEDDPERLDRVRARRQLIHELLRKYGPTLDDVLAFADSGRARLAALAGVAERAAALDVEVAAARADVDAAAAVVARDRRRVAPVLASEIEATLHDLAMPSARFGIRVEGEGSADDVTFELAANPGEPARPLAKAASGGELSRTMLAVRLALTDAPGVLVFDEVDAGVGGAAATAVGTALAGLGHHAQVLVVTHLAQVAAQADHQIGVRKVESDGRTRSEVTVLGADGRVVEISRMLSGSPDSDAARRHARELLGVRGPSGGSAQ
ncbi:MAG: DNA repair protein RecN [Acidimicrobiales bacterium]|jgi:DNA repair protein RecN (Recombination protein N)